MLFSKKYKVQTDARKISLESEHDRVHRESGYSLAGALYEKFPPVLVEHEQPNIEVWEQKVVILSHDQYTSLVTIANRLQDHELHELVGKMQGKP